MLYTFAAMKKFTQAQALDIILNVAGLSKKMITYRHRYKNGLLSQKAIGKLLKANKFIVHSEVIYSRK